MSEDYFNFLKQPIQKVGISGKDGVQNTNGAQKVDTTGNTNVQKRYQFFTGFNSGASTGNGVKNVEADNAIKSAEKLLSSISDEIIKSQLKGSIDKLKELVESGASESQIQAAIKELKNKTAQATSIRPAMGV